MAGNGEKGDICNDGEAWWNATVQECRLWLMLEPLGQDLWFADGGIVSFKGFDYPTRMVIVRLADGGLWLWSPVEKTAALEQEVRALGPVRHIVSPNSLHYLFEPVAGRISRGGVVGHGRYDRQAQRSPLFQSAGRCRAGRMGATDRSVLFYELTFHG